MTIRLRTIALLAAAALPVAACSDDFLTESPPAFVAPENFYQNQGDAIAAVNAAYATFITPGNGIGGSDYYGRNWYMLVEYPTEYLTGRLSATNIRSLMDNYHTSFSSNHEYLETVWRAAYSGINRANSVIERVPAVPMDTVRRNKIVGEAKFLRALHYYSIAGLYGGVPLKLTETKGFASDSTPRATAAATWAQIEQDLTDAAAVLPASWPTSDFGRATRGAALALLAKAYLQDASMTGNTAQYPRAVAALAQVRALGYALDANYASLFDGSNERSREIVFSIQNIRVDGLGGRLTEWASPITSPALWIGGAQNHFLAERPFYESYAATDVRKNGTWLTSFTRTDGRTVTWAWNSTGCTSATAANCITSPNQYGSLGPASRKYLDLGSADGGMEEPDYIVSRYADVLLLSAEAINEVSGPTTEALGYVNQVRTRAGLPALALPASKQAFKDAIFVERRWELAMEGHGMFDSRRNWEWAKARVMANIALITNTTTGNRFSIFNSSVPKFNPGSIADKWKLYPVPVGACRMNGALAQNPGWEDGICGPVGG